MNKKKILIVLIFIISVVSVYWFYENSYTEFKPLSFDGSNYVIKKIANKKEFESNLKKVLEYYNEDFKISEKGNITIKNKLQADEELITNYTKKALDKDWNKTK